jgi:hypothetical protein
MVNTLFFFVLIENENFDPFFLKQKQLEIIIQVVLENLLKFILMKKYEMKKTTISYKKIFYFLLFSIVLLEVIYLIIYLKNLVYVFNQEMKEIIIYSIVYVLEHRKVFEVHYELLHQMIFMFVYKHK